MKFQSKCLSCGAEYPGLNAKEAAMSKCVECGGVIYHPDNQKKIEKGMNQTTMKNRIKCQGCGKILKADGMQPRSSAACPNCGNTVTVPFPGMGAGKFAGLYFGSWFAIILLIAMLGQVGGILIPVWFGYKLRLGYLRAINIGWGPLCCLLVILPFIGAIVLACYATGEGMKKGR